MKNNNLKEQLNQHIEKIAAPLCEMADTIFDHPEMGFQEYKSSALLCNWLKKNGFNVIHGVCGLDTAFHAVYERGKDGPSIGLLCEYDALPIGHACGHHLQGPVILAVADALKNIIIDKPFKLIVYGTPAEEGLQGKARMLANGCFNDIDIALMMHAGDHTTVDVKSLAGARLDVDFKGVSAHPSLAPELTRDALDGLLLTFQGIEFMRGHVKKDVSLVYGIKDCVGMPNNKDQTSTEGYVVFRTYHSCDVEDLEKRITDIFKGAALMTGTKVGIAKSHEMVGKLPSHVLNKLILDNAQALSAPQILRPHRERTGATDFAFVSRHVPSAVCRVAFVPEGTPSHSQAFLEAGKSQRAHEAIRLGAKIIAGVAVDLIYSSETFQAVLKEYKNIKAAEGNAGRGSTAI